MSFNSNSQQACQGYQEDTGKNSIEIIDDDVAIIDQSMFDEAKNNSRRNHSRTNHSQVIDGLKDVLNAAAGLLNSLSEMANRCCKRKRDAADESISSRCPRMMEEAKKRNKVILTKLNVETTLQRVLVVNHFFPHNPCVSCHIQAKNTVKLVEFPKNPELDAPKFICPICIGPLSLATTTKCGHVFCQECIKKAMQLKGNALLAGRNLESEASSGCIFLPTANSIK
ncbi:uncharacterized protein LOC123211576 [Mangifera indica]|uniref:uncharacterized protein LOC123211576 n=1 Tax=Mangifera indica TaxID=29780 RepID=UPI001CFB31D9|nr:uncharacterized protein LOC123211576 [Mangifera indica]